MKNDNSIWHRNGFADGAPDAWQSMSHDMGTPSHVHVTSSGEVWAIGDNNTIYYRPSMTEDWVQCPGQIPNDMTQLAVSSDGNYVIGVNNNNSILYREGGFAGGAPEAWQGIWHGMGTPSCLRVTPGGEVWAIGDNNTIYYRPSMTEDWVQCSGHQGTDNMTHINVGYI